MKKTEALLAPSSILPHGGGGRTTRMLYGLAADDTPVSRCMTFPPSILPCGEEAGRETLDAA